MVSVSEKRCSAARHSASGRPELLAHDVGALHHRHHLVGGVAAAHALAAHAAVGRDDQPLGRNVFERLADQRRDLVRPLDLQGVVVDHADDDLLVLDHLADRLEVAGARRAGLEGERVGVDLVERFERGLIALHVAEDALLRRVAPAGVAPHFGLRPQPLHGVVEDLARGRRRRACRRSCRAPAPCGFAAPPSAAPGSRRRPAR